MSHYKAYSKYKKTGVEWLEKLPRHWKVVRLKHNSYIKARVGWHGLSSEEHQNEGAYLVTGTDFFYGKIDWENCVHVPEERYRQDPYIILKDGDLLITKDGTIGKTAIVESLGEGKATLNSGVFVIRPSYGSYETSFLYWVFNSKVFTSFISLESAGSTIQHLYQRTLNEFTLPIAHIDEQQAIATFLDRETARIDALIEKKQRQIELLKEKRQAIITQAVTKGLDPDVPMKDSRVEWLGEVPEHWGVVSLRWLMRIGSGEFLSNVDFAIESDESKNIPVIGGNGIAGYTSKAIFENALVIGRVGALCGNVHYINSPCWVTDNALVVKNLGTFDAEFLTFSFKMLDLNRLANQNAQPLVTGEMIKKQKVAVPPLNEQCQITNHINKELLKSDNLVEKTEKSIVLLKERRSALITAAVTGQIDVREEV